MCVEKIPCGNKTYSGVAIFPLNAASCPARRIVSRMNLVALPPFIRDDPLMASAYEERPELLMMGGHSINISNHCDIFCSMPVSCVLQWLLGWLLRCSGQLVVFCTCTDVFVSMQCLIPPIQDLG